MPNSDSESCGSAAADVQCIFYCIFHHEAGPKIELQDPSDFLTKENFDKISRYFITKNELNNRLIWLDAFGSRIMGSAQCIEGKRYKRNALHFNIGLVISMHCSAPVQYEMIARKLGRYFHNLEVETAFLSSEESLPRLRQVLTDIRTSLNSRGSCELPVMPQRALQLFLKPAPPLLAARSPADFEVPILAKRELPSKTDIVTALILPYIDGVSHVAKIARLADVDKNVVQMCLQNLCSFHAVRYLPLTLYSDSYACLTGVLRLVTDKEFGRLCQQEVTLSQLEPRPTATRLFRLLSCMVPGSTLKDLLTLHSGLAANVDILRLVQFGLLHSLIRRVNTYPIRLADNANAIAIGLDATGFYGLLDGYHSLDEICATSGMSRHRLEEMLDCDSSVVLVRR